MTTPPHTVAVPVRHDVVAADEHLPTSCLVPLTSVNWEGDSGRQATEAASALNALKAMGRTTMGRTERGRNEKLAAFIDASGWSYEACAAAIRAVASESGDDLASCRRSHVAKWLAGVQPSGRTPEVMLRPSRDGWGTSSSPRI